LKCLCECYMMALSSSRNVYVNVTWWQYQVLKMFIWMLHGDNIKFSKCLFECYMMALSSSQNVLCKCYMMALSSSQNVYVNVTWWRCQVLEMFM
jgi:hypothetical protein